jgi:hypothetical protein
MRFAFSTDNSMFTLTLNPQCDEINACEKRRKKQPVFSVNAPLSVNDFDTNLFRVFNVVPIAFLLHGHIRHIFTGTAKPIVRFLLEALIDAVSKFFLQILCRFQFGFVTFFSPGCWW